MEVHCSIITSYQTDLMIVSAFLYQVTCPVLCWDTGHQHLGQETGGDVARCSLLGQHCSLITKEENISDIHNGWS